MSEWIKCTDKMPDVDKWVLVYSENIGGEPIITSCYLTTCDRFPILWNMYSSGCGCCDSCLQHVTHWMPLPERPND